MQCMCHIHPKWFDNYENFKKAKEHRQHGLAIAMTAAFDMYIACCEGNLDPSCAIAEKDQTSYGNSGGCYFLSRHAFGYNPKLNKYSDSGDGLIQGLHSTTQNECGIPSMAD